MQLLHKKSWSEIFKTDRGNLLKLYNGWVSDELIFHEFNTTYAAFEKGLPCARPLKIIEKGFRKGILFEFIKGPTLASLLIKRPWSIKKYGKQMALLHKKVHIHKNIDHLDKQTFTLKNNIGKSLAILEPYQSKIDEYLECLLIEENILCHGDLTPYNILVASKGLVLIDWADAFAGNPVSDVARSNLRINTPSFFELNRIPNALKKIVKKGVTVFNQIYVNEYFKDRPDFRQMLSAWQIPLAAERLAENVPGEKEWLLGIIKDGQADYLNKLKTS